MRPWLRIDKSGHVPCLFIGELRIFIGCSQRHSVFNISGKAAKAVKSCSGIVTLGPPKGWIHETTAVREHYSFSPFSMTRLALAYIHDFSCQRVGSPHQHIGELNGSGADRLGSLWNILADPF